MALSPKQLRLVFAKLRAKGLLQRVRKGLFYQKSPPSVLSKVKRGFWKSFEPEGIERLTSRLPVKHRDLSGASRVTLGADINTYNPRTGEIEVDVSTAYDIPYEYGPRSISKPHKSGGAPWHQKLTSQRNAKIGAAKGFYHEYGHSIDVRQTGSHPSQRFSASPEWHGILREEWRLKEKELFLHPGNPRLLRQQYVPATEAWADSYSHYAGGRISRHKFKKKYPRSYEYMKKFFEEGQ